MTYTESMITVFVEQTIDTMNKTVEFYSKDHTRSSETRRGFALEIINNEHNKAYGALLFTQIYLNEIEEADYNKLKNTLSDALANAVQKALEDIK